MNQSVIPIARGDAARRSKPPGAGIDVRALPPELMATVFPARSYTWGKYTPVRATAALIAEGKTGKSTLSLMRQLHGAAGKPLFGLNTLPGLYVYLSCEDDFEEVQRRAQKILEPFTPEERAAALANFIIVDGVGKGLQFITTTKGAVGISDTVDRIIAAVLRAADGRRVVDVAIDTVSRINGGQENDNHVMATVEAAGSRIAQRLNAAVTLLHHTGKQAAREGIADAHTGRGASSFGDNCRSVLRLMPATFEMVRAFEGIDRATVERGDVLKLVHAALNFDRKSDPLWMRRTHNGLLEQFTPERRDEAADAATMLDDFAAWWEKSGRKPFTKTAVCRSAASHGHLQSIWPRGVSEAMARNFFETQLGERTFIATSEKARGGAVAYTLNHVTAEALLIKATGAERAAEAAWNGATGTNTDE